MGTGFMRCILTSGDECIDTIPVDQTANALIAAAWETATNKYDISFWHIFNNNCDTAKRCVYKFVTANEQNIGDHKKRTSNWRASAFR